MDAGVLPALSILLAACTTVPPRLAPPMPATLAAVRDLAPHPCNATTAMVLDGLGVPPGSIRSIYYDRRVTGGETTYLQGYDAWVRMKDQPGDLVIDHNSSCRFITSYTRGSVRLEPVRSP